MIEKLILWYKHTFTEYCRVCNKSHAKDGDGKKIFCYVCQKKHKYHTWTCKYIDTEKGKQWVCICGAHESSRGYLSPTEKIKSRILMPNGEVISGREGVRERDRRLRAQERYGKS